MIKQNNNQKYGVWWPYFCEGYTHDGYQRQRLNADHWTHNLQVGIDRGTIHIKDDVDTPLSDNPELDAWCNSAYGQKVLTDVSIDLHNQILSVEHFALPAHDVYQINCKDVVEALRYAEHEKPQGYKAAFVLGKKGHDIGRLVEGRFFHPDNPHHQWVPHAAFSHIMLRDVLDRHDVPQALKHHLLYAVSAHSGENGNSYMSRAIQTCDRSQLLGAEGLFRSMAYCLCVTGAQFKYPEDEFYRTNMHSMFGIKSVMALTEYVSRNMRPNIGEVYKEKRQDPLQVENVALLLKMTERNSALREKIFAPEIEPFSDICTFGDLKKKIPSAIFKQAQIMVMDERYGGGYTRPLSPHDLTKQIVGLLQSPIGAAPITPAMERSIMQAMVDLSPVERCDFKDTLAMAAELRVQQDELDRQVLLRAMNSPLPYYRHLAQTALDYIAPAIPQSVKVQPSLSTQPSPDLEIR